MQFASTSVLYLLLPLAIGYAIARHYVQKRQQRVSEFVQPTLFGQLLCGPQGLSPQRMLFGLFCTLVLLCFALARPQWGFEWRERSQSGIDLVLAIDVSSSMLAQDVSPTRLERARREVIDLLDHLQGDRVGLVSFAGVAFAESPLTLDYSAFKLFLNSLTPDLIPVGGTNIQAALKESLRILGEQHTAGRAKAILLITDGEEFDGDTSALVDTLTRQGVRIYILGVGTEEGAPIPTPQGHKRDAQGNVIISKLYPERLEALASETAGTYIQSVASDKDTRQIYEEGMRRQLEAKSIEWGSAKRYNEYFQLPLSLALLLLLYLWIPWKTWFVSTNKTLLCLLIPLLYSLVLTSSAEAQTAETLGQEAREAFSNAKFDKAASLFDQALAQTPGEPRLLVGKASSLYRQGRYEEALQYFAQAAKLLDSAKERAKQYFNAGNSLAQLQRYQEAIALYEESLSLAPEDEETKANLAYVEKLLEEQQQDKEESSSDQENNKDKSSEQKSESKKEKDSEQDEQSDQKDQQDQESESDQKSESEQDQQSNDSQDSQQQQQEDDSSEGQDSNDTEDRDQQQGQDTDSTQDTPENAQDEKEQEQQATPKDAPEEKEEDSAAADEQEESEQSEEERQEESEQQTAASQATEQNDKEPPLSSEDLMQLRSVQEQRGAQIRFRAKKAIQQLKELETDLPTKDW